MPRKADQEKALRALADVVVRERTLKGLTQEEVADAAGISVQYLRRIEAGRGNPSFLALRGIGSALGVALADLIRRAR